MKKQELDNLRKSMESAVIKESRHIGLTNVNQRIRLYYGDEYGLTMESTEGIGTTITVRIPQI